MMLRRDLIKSPPVFMPLQLKLLLAGLGLLIAVGLAIALSLLAKG